MYFNKVAAEYQSRKDLVFVGIDNTHVDLLDEKAARAERLQLLKNYTERSKLTYQIILDDWIAPPDIRGSNFKIARDYGVDGRSQYFIIDKEGIVRFKNNSNQYVPAFLERELKAALKLVPPSN